MASINFVGQSHKWRLTEWLQKGTERNRETLLDDLAFSLQFLLVTAKARLFSHFFSTAESIKAILIGAIKLIGMIKIMNYCFHMYLIFLKLNITFQI